jgi:hypothetical protein
VDERRTGQKRGTGWRPTFVLKAARWRGQRGKRVGVGVDASMWRREKEETGRGGGAGAVVGSTGWSAMAPNRRARVASLPREQRRAAGVGDTSEGG